MKELIKKKIRGSVLPVFTLLFFLLVSNAAAQQQQSQEENRTQLHWAQRSSEILDKKIVSSDGKELGTAKEFVIGRDGKIEYVIISVGGFLGIGSKNIVVPWDKIRSTPNANLLVAEVSQFELQWQPEEHEMGGGTQQAEQRGGREPLMPLAQMDPERAEGFVDYTVAGKNGEELGKLADLFTTRDGRPTYVVIEDDSKKLHPLPAQLVRANPEDKTSLSADIDKHAFLNSPSFDRSQMSQLEWEAEVRSYYEERFQSGQSTN